MFKDNSPQNGPNTVGTNTQGPHTKGPHTKGPHTEGPHTKGPHTEGPHTKGLETQKPSDGRHGSFCVELNGEMISFPSSETKIELRMLLEKAGSKAGISVSELSNYYLTVFENDKTIEYDNLDAIVDLFDGMKCVATYKGKTPVA